MNSVQINYILELIEDLIDKERTLATTDGCQFEEFESVRREAVESQLKIENYLWNLVS